MYREHIDREALEVLHNPNVMEKLTVESATLLDTPGAMRLEDGVFYLKANISAGAGTFDLIKTSDVEKVGTRNFNTAELPDLENLVLEEIELEYATHATETDPAKITTYSSKKPSTAVPALEYGELVIEQDDKPVYSCPISDFFQATDVDDKAKKRVPLKNFKVIAAGRKFAVKIKFAEGQSIQSAAEQHHVSIKLIGSKTKKNA